MNKTIKALNKQLSNSQADIGAIETKLQTEWNKVFDDSGKVKTMISKVEDSRDYSFTEYGEVASYVSVDLSDFQDCKTYFEGYMIEHCIEVDWVNDCLNMSQGESMIIQDDTRNDNGVWLNGKCVIDEREYKENGEVDETKRNSLIESYMEKHGYFPGVFRADSHGNVFVVNTKE